MNKKKLTVFFNLFGDEKRKVIIMKKRNLLIIIVALLIVSIALTLMYWVPHLAPKVYTEGHLAYIGRLTIPSVGIDVACYEFDPQNEQEVQEMYAAMDEEDAAVKFWFSASKIENGVLGSWVIGDHSNQSFGTLKKCAVGDSVYFSAADGTQEEYVITDNFLGKNEKWALTVDGESIICNNPDGIILYTCADETTVPVHIIFLQPVTD